MKRCRVPLSLLTILLTVWLGGWTSSLVRADIVIDGDRMTVTTDHLIAYFRGADLMRLTNRLTQEQYLHTTSRFEPLLDVHMLVSPGTPLQTTGWRRGVTINANPDAAMTTFNDLTRTIYISVIIEPQTQDIMIAFWAEAVHEANVKGLTWGLRGLDLTSGRLVLPANGGCYADRDGTPAALSLDYPSQWQAQMAIWETKRGGFVVYSRDEKAHYKKLHITRRGDYADVAFETEAVAPWKRAGGVPQLEWRINAFKGDWRVPAQGYRNVMNFQHKPIELRGPRAWVRDIRTVATVQGDKYDPALLDALSKQLDPKKTLLYLIDWRLGGQDANYPDYSPREKVRPFVEKAREMGFRVMLHASLNGVSPGNEDFARVQRYQMKDALTVRPLGNRWDQPETDSRRYAFINPASKAYRDLFLARLTVAMDELHPDAIHLDGSSRIVNDGNGLIEDKNAAQGVVALQRAIVSVFPGLVLSGDAMNELISPYDGFAQWSASGPLPPHPISAFLFGDHILPYAGPGLPNPDQSPSEYHKLMAQYAAQGALPTIVLSSAGDIADGRPGLRGLLKLARAWQNHDLLPDWNGDWTSALFRYQGLDGSHATVESAPGGIRIKIEDQVLYQAEKSAGPPAASK